MKINELLLKDGGMKYYLVKKPSIFGTIKLVNDIYEINYWFKSIFQNTYHEDSLDVAKSRLKSLLVNAYQQLDENKVIPTFENFNSNNIHLKKFQLFEYINPKLFEYTLSSLISDMKKIDKNLDTEYNTRKNDNLYILDVYTDNMNKIIPLLEKYKTKFKKMNIHLSYKYHFHIKIVLKDIYIRRIKPTKYLYHVSKSENRKNILKDGLMLSDNKNFVELDDLNRPDAIFATTEDIGSTISKMRGFGDIDISIHYTTKIDDNLRVWYDYNPLFYDIWQINTSKIKNKWFQDLNIPKINGIILTYDHISPNAIKLYKKGGEDDS